MLYKLAPWIICLLLAGGAITANSFAKGGSSGGGGGGRGGGGSSSGSKSSGGSKPSNSGSKSSSSSKPKLASPSKPSTGSKAQPAPVTKLIPPRAPAGSFLSQAPGTRKTVESLGKGRSWQRDRNFISRNPRYADPYYSRGIGGAGYYGFTDSPFFYMWIGGMFDGDRNRPLPPSSDDEISEAIVSYLGLIDAQMELSRP
jgi:hypothetical protein